MTVTQQTSPRTPAIGPSLESTLLTLAVLALVVALMSTVTLVPRSSLDAGNVASGSAGPGIGPGAAANSSVGDPSLAQQPSADADGVVTEVVEGGPAGEGDAGGNSQGPAASTGQGGGGTGGGSGGGGGAGGNATAKCEPGQNGGKTDTGVTANSIKLGMVTVDSGPGASFLQPMGIAVQAVIRKVNASGGICGRGIELIPRDSGWEADVGLRYIKNLVEGDKVFALVVNPDSEGLDQASQSGYLASQNVPVIGTDGLLFSQYTDANIWPIAASTVTAMHAIAQSQHASGRTQFSLVYEKTYRFGREGASAYNAKVKELTGKDIPGYVDPAKNAQCKERFCGIVANQQGYGAEANEINSACRGSGGTAGCDAGAVLLEPATAITWFNSGGRFGGTNSPEGGGGAAPQPLFTRNFADGCQRTCHQMRLWTGFFPPIEQFASRPGVRQYIDDMKSFASTVDVNNQFAEGAYLGARLAVDAMTAASVLPGGLTRENVMKVLDSTKNYDIGLTVKPLSWSPGNHFALTSVHAFDESYPAGFGGWQYVQGSEITDPNPTKI